MSRIDLLTSVLHVSKLFVSLISVQKIAKMNEYQILFDDVNTFPCNKVHGWKIRLAKFHCGLYYIHPTPLSVERKTDSKVAAVTSITAREKITLLHRGLG